MNATRSVGFDVELSPKERTALKRVLGVKDECEIEKVARLTVIVKVELQDKLPEANPAQ